MSASGSTHCHFTRLRGVEDDPSEHVLIAQHESKFSHEHEKEIEREETDAKENVDVTYVKRLSGITIAETRPSSSHKDEETYQYKLAMGLFSLDPSCWSNIRNIMEQQVISDNAQHMITQEDKLKVLEAVKQWIESSQLIDEKTVDEMKEPLTPDEKEALNSLSNRDWEELDSDQLREMAKLLLREYESFPRKAKPKTCKHCNKTYTASTSLHSHLVSLSGIRYWFCSRCQDSNNEAVNFTRKHSLLYHILKENDIPRYICLEPGCNRRHNHTHHQKSHARQHTGEKYFQCAVDDCSIMFSNRNTYSRHLLQFHNIELLRNNELKQIGPVEANQKVQNARLKARFRSKLKRLHNNSTVVSLRNGINVYGTRHKQWTRSNDLVITTQEIYPRITLPAKQTAAEGSAYDPTVNGGSLAAVVENHSAGNQVPQYFSSGSNQSNTEPKNLQKTLPGVEINTTASRLLSGIARDFSSGPPESVTKQSPPMRGLDLLWMAVEGDIDELHGSGSIK